MGGALNALASVRAPALDELASILTSFSMAGSPSAMAGHPSPFSNAEAFASLLEGLDSPPPFSNAEAVASLLEGLDSPPNFFNHPANPPLVPLVEALTSFLDGAGALLQEAGAFK